MSYIKRKIDVELDKLSNYAVEKMKAKIESLPASGSHDSTGASNWRLQVKEAIKFKGYNESLNIIRKIGLVDANELTTNRALLINYGMGNTLYKDNPYLEEYKKSAYYYKKRDNYNVYKRDGDQVYDYESGTWYTSTAKPKDEEIEVFWQTPSLFFDTIMVEIQQEFNFLIDRIFDNVDFSQFLESTNK
jgi:hypothetical protein